MPYDSPIDFTIARIKASLINNLPEKDKPTQLFKDVEKLFASFYDSEFAQKQTIEAFEIFLGIGLGHLGMILNSRMTAEFSNMLEALAKETN